MKKPKRLKNHAFVVKGAAWSYVLLAFLYPIFTLSAFKFPQAGKSIETLLEQFVAGGASDHVWWTLFTFIPLLLIFGGIGFYSAVKPYSFRLSGLALILSVFAAVSFLLGIGRWSTMNWGLGEAFLLYKENSEYLAEAYIVSNKILGYWIGQIFAEISLFASIGMMSIAMFNSKRFPIWLSGFAGLIFILGVAATFRDVNTVASWSYWLVSTFMLVPIFFILLSVALFRFIGKSKEKPITSYSKKKRNAKTKSKKSRFNKRKKQVKKP